MTAFWECGLYLLTRFEIAVAWTFIFRWGYLALAFFGRRTLLLWYLLFLWWGWLFLSGFSVRDLVPLIGGADTAEIRWLWALSLELAWNKGHWYHLLPRLQVHLLRIPMAGKKWPLRWSKWRVVSLVAGCMEAGLRRSPNLNRLVVDLWLLVREIRSFGVVGSSKGMVIPWLHHWMITLRVPTRLHHLSIVRRHKHHRVVVTDAWASFRVNGVVGEAVHWFHLKREVHRTRIHLVFLFPLLFLVRRCHSHPLRRQRLLWRTLLPNNAL